MSHTKVQFLIERDGDDVFAYFPKMKYHAKGHPQYRVINSSYSRIGQHSACHEDYARFCNKATPEQYQSLREELESIGYKLHILN